MKADAGATRARIVAAARIEFAAYGLAGARVDRISVQANASKERLYAYFGDKDSLFHATLEDGFNRFVDAVHFDVLDLGAYAARAYRHMSREPEEHRILLWAQLQGDPKLHDKGSAGDVIGDRIEAISRAQRENLITDDVAAADLMTLIFGIISSWMTTPGQDAAPASAVEIDRRCVVIEFAVRRLVEVRQPHASLI